MVEMVDTLINGRWNLKLPAHRAARPEWDIANGGWEKERLEHMHEYIVPGQRVLYVGMEEADMCGLLASWGAKVFMVEPNELVWPNAKAIWDANGFEDPWGMYVGFCGAVSSDNMIEGYYRPNWPGCAFGPVIGDHGFKELRDPGERPVIAIDDMALAFDVIVMDVEGSEFEVLKGATGVIDRYHPAIYLSGHPEFLIDQYGTYLADVRHWIEERGYKETLLAYPKHEVHLFYEWCDAR